MCFLLLILYSITHNTLKAMKKSSFIFSVFLAGAFFSCTKNEPKESVFTVKVWENGAEEFNGIEKVEFFKNDSSDVYNISESEINLFLVNNKRVNSGKMVLICPGGGYGMQAIRKEGWAMAEWLNKEGVNAAVLKYRLPNGQKDIPLKDAKKAMKILRENASLWGYDANKIGVCGYSAGGHLASTLATKYDELSRPDFQILFYPVISFIDTLTHWGTRKNLLGDSYMDESLVLEYSNEKHIDANSPKAILFHSMDDKAVTPWNSILYKEALDNNNVKCELYTYPSGNHGWGTLTEFDFYDEWTTTLSQWLKEN